MWILIDLNIVGIITKCLEDDFNFLYFINKHNIKPYYKDINWEYINWDDVSREVETYDMEMIEEFKDNFNWNSITSLKINDQQFLERYIDYINFDLINQKMRFSYTIDYDFFENHHEKFDWVKLSRWADMAEDFIDIFHERLDWDILSRTQGLTEYLLNKYVHKIVLAEIRYNYHIDPNLRNEFITRLENTNNTENEEDIDIENEEDIDIENEEEDVGNGEEDIDMESEEDIDMENNDVLEDI